jgi:hypothetical protein
MEPLILRIPHNEYHIVSLILREATVLDERYDEEFTWISCRIPRRLINAVQEYAYNGAFPLEDSIKP